MSKNTTTPSPAKSSAANDPANPPAMEANPDTQQTKIMQTLIITIGKMHYHITLNKKTGILNATIFENGKSLKRLGTTNLSKEEVKELIGEFLKQGE